MINKLIATIGVIITYSIVYSIYNPVSTLFNGEIAGNQFDNSDTSAIIVPVAFNTINGINVLMSIALIVVLGVIWRKTLIYYFNIIRTNISDNNNDNIA